MNERNMNDPLYEGVDRTGSLNQEIEDTLRRAQDENVRIVETADTIAIEDKTGHTVMYNNITEVKQAREEQKKQFFKDKAPSNVDMLYSPRQLYEAWVQEIQTILAKNSHYKLELQLAPNSDNVIAAHVIDSSVGEKVKSYFDPNLISMVSRVHGVGLEPLDIAGIDKYNKAEPRVYNE